VSAASLTVPASGANLVGSQNLTFAETQTTTSPDGNTTGPLSGATNGEGSSDATWICVTTKALPVQPSVCSTLNTLPAFLPPNGLCVPDTSAQTAGHTGPSVTLNDVGISGTYNIVACKDYMTWSTNTAAVSFTPYSRTIAMTGAPADFNAGETIQAVGGVGDDGYVSWDTQFLYLGFSNTVLAATDYVQAYVGSSNGTGVETADNVKVLYAGATAPSFPAGFNALYHVWWKADNTDQGINAFTTGWVTTANNAFEVQFNQASHFVEFAIPLTSLATAGTDLHLLGGDWTGTVNLAEWPSAAGNNDGANWLGWQTELLNDAFLPNDATNLNVP
jgi:hypothetical protein